MPPSAKELFLSIALERSIVLVGINNGQVTQIPGTLRVAGDLPEEIRPVRSEPRLWTILGATGFASVRYATWASDSALAEPVAHRTKRTTFCPQVFSRFSLCERTRI